MRVAIIAKNVAPGTAGLVGFCIAALMAGTALADDSSSNPSADWAGFYVGLSAGAHVTNDHWTTQNLASGGFSLSGSDTADLGTTTGRVGLYGGYNFPVSPSVVLGFEVDVAGDLGDKKSVNGIPGATYTSSNTGGDQIQSESDIDASFRARVGYVVTPGFLLYGAGGIAIQSQKYSVSCPGGFLSTNSWCGANESGSTTNALVGWTVGAGLETEIMPNWVARVDYRYSDFGRQNINFFQTNNFGVDEVSAKTTLDSHIAVVGLAYKF
ncbi:MAG: outer membrane beta-barrel protein [Azospirillaceae bacterium]|nr:outer membrane beta-barrel protein [Azospirillaceae bacterium]